MGSGFSSSRGSLKHGYKSGDKFVGNETKENGRDRGRQRDLGSINEATTTSLTEDSDDEKNESDQIRVTETLNKKTFKLENDRINCYSDIKENVTSGKKYISANGGTLKEKHREKTEEINTLEATDCSEKHQQIMQMFEKNKRSSNSKCLLENAYQVLMDTVQDKTENSTRKLFECALDIDVKDIAKVIDKIEERKSTDEEEANTDMVILEYDERKNKGDIPS